jgi:hypothetical protein
MKTLEKDELYQNLQGFLKAKGVELKDGSYSVKIQKSCALLSDAINTSQRGLSRAKVEIDKKLGQLRQVIHEKTAAPGASAPPPKQKPAQQKATAAPKAGQTKARGRKRRKTQGS